MMLERKYKFSVLDNTNIIGDNFKTLNEACNYADQYLLTLRKCPFQCDTLNEKIQEEYKNKFNNTTYKLSMEIDKDRYISIKREVYYEEDSDDTLKLYEIDYGVYGNDIVIATNCRTAAALIITSGNNYNDYCIGDIEKLIEKLKVREIKNNMIISSYGDR